MVKSMSAWDVNRSWDVSRKGHRAGKMSAESTGTEQLHSQTGRPQIRKSRSS